MVLEKLLTKSLEGMIVRRGGQQEDQGPQRLHYPLIKEYTLNHIRDPYYNLRYMP